MLCYFIVGVASNIPAHLVEGRSDSAWNVTLLFFNMLKYLTLKIKRFYSPFISLDKSFRNWWPIVSHMWTTVTTATGIAHQIAPSSVSVCEWDILELQRNSLLKSTDSSLWRGFIFCHHLFILFYLSSWYFETIVLLQSLILCINILHWAYKLFIT